MLYVTALWASVVLLGIQFVWECHVVPPNDEALAGADYTDTPIITPVPTIASA